MPESSTSTKGKVMPRFASCTCKLQMPDGRVIEIFNEEIQKVGAVKGKYEFHQVFSICGRPVATVQYSGEYLRSSYSGMRATSFFVNWIEKSSDEAVMQFLENYVNKKTIRTMHAFLES